MPKSSKLPLLLSSLFIFLFSNGSELHADILQYFKKDLSKVPSREKLTAQEPIAKIELTKALENEKKGRAKAAFNTHRKIIKKFPFTSSAAESQFKIGEYFMNDGKEKKAFEAFQTFIDKHKSSDSYIQAVSNQYKIASSVLTKKKQKKLKILPDSVRDSELLEWFQAIIENAPFSEYSPLAQFALAESYQKDKKISLAIASYQKLVDKYPNHKLSPEAQYRIGDIARKQINLGSRDAANITHAKNAMEDVIVAYENSPRAKEAEIALKQLSSMEETQYYETGIFYEKQNQLRSAVIYYEKAAKSKDKALRELALKRINLISQNSEIKSSSDQKNPLTEKTSSTNKKKESIEVKTDTKKIDTTTPDIEEGPIILPPPPKQS